VLPPALRPRAPARLRPVGPKSTPLLRIQGPAIVERRGGWPINPTTGSTIANRVDRSAVESPQHLSEILAMHFDFRDAGANKLNARDILTQ